MIKHILYFIFWIVVNIFIILCCPNIHPVIFFIIQFTFISFAPLPAWVIKKKDIKQVPLKIISPLESDNKVAGYCPTCQGTILIENTFLRRLRGYYCSWCGQKIDCDEIFKED